MLFDDLYPTLVRVLEVCTVQFYDIEVSTIWQQLPVKFVCTVPRVGVAVGFPNQIAPSVVDFDQTFRETLYVFDDPSVVDSIAVGSEGIDDDNGTLYEDLDTVFTVATP